MEDQRRTLVVLLSMHRSGSSLTAQTFQRMGMSLGPFELNGAAPSNPYGHFESVPFLLLNDQVQSLAHGFKADLPDSADVLARFVASRGVWGDDVHIPEELYDEGRVLVQALVDSAPISGFKDPRTVLAWPFWRRVFESFPDVRIVPVGLVRSPHEMAMSLVSRRKGCLSYWDSLDVVGVHLSQLRAILGEFPDHPPCLCFGPTYLKTLEAVVPRCGLTWHAVTAVDVFDPSCVHHEPATVAHQAQAHFEALRGDPAVRFELPANLERLEADARALERMRLGDWRKVQEQLDHLQEELRITDSRLDHAENALHAATAQLAEREARLNDAHDRLSHAWAQLGALHASHNETQDELAKLRELAHQWRTRLEKWESHPVFSLALKGRRQIKSLIARRQAG